jgi:hypothetical protein
MWINIPQLEVLAALQGELLLGLALGALKTQDNLLGGLGLLVEDGLGLTTVTTLLPVVTALTLGEEGGLFQRFESAYGLVGVGRCGEGTYLASLVLGDLVLGVLVAVLGLAVRPAGFGDVDLYGNIMSICFVICANGNMSGSCSKSGSKLLRLRRYCSY